MRISLTSRVSAPLLALLWVCTAPGLALGRDVTESGASGGVSTFQRRMERAEHLYESLEYEKALDWLAQAKQVASSIEEQVRVALYRGVVLADLGRRKLALEAFRAGLSLHPDSVLPVEVSPKVQRDFESVRKQVLKKQATTAARAGRTADAEVDAPLSEPTPMVEAEPAPAAVAAKPEPAAAPPAPSSTLSDLRTRLGVTGEKVGRIVGSALGSALDTVVGTKRKQEPAPEAAPTAQDAP